MPTPPATGAGRSPSAQTRRSTSTTRSRSSCSTSSVTPSPKGSRRSTSPDWGLDNVAGARRARARLPALRRASGGTLRAARADGADDRLPRVPRRAREDPLALDDDPATPIAVAARVRFEASTWRAPIEEALARTAALVEARHPIGFLWGPAGETCGSCAWLYLGGRGAPVARCRQTAPTVGRRRADGAGRIAPARAGSRRSTARPAALAAARPITRSPSRCAIRSSGRSPI